MHPGREVGITHQIFLLLSLASFPSSISGFIMIYHFRFSRHHRKTILFFQRFKAKSILNFMSHSQISYYFSRLNPTQIKILKNKSCSRHGFIRGLRSLIFLVPLLHFSPLFNIYIYSPPPPTPYKVGFFLD